MTAISNVSELVNRLTGGNNGLPEFCAFYKNTSGFATLGSIPMSLWTAPGQPGPGATPGAAAIPTNATAGAMRHLDPTGGRQRWLRSLSASAWVAGKLTIYDRLLHSGGLSATVTTAQAVGTDVTRYTGQSSLGSIILAEVYTIIGATATTISCNYLDKDGTSRASGSIGLGAASGRSPGTVVQIPFNVTTGANSVTRVVDCTLAATTGTAGNFGITIARPLFDVDIGAVDIGGVGTGTLAVVLDDIELLTGACLGVLFTPALSAQNYVRGHYQTLER